LRLLNALLIIELMGVFALAGGDFIFLFGD